MNCKDYYLILNKLFINKKKIIYIKMNNKQNIMIKFLIKFEN